MPPPVQPHPSRATQPSMADVWNEYPTDPGMVSALVARQVALQAPLQHLVAQQPSIEPLPVADREPRLRVVPYADPAGWTLLKHLMQLALVASAVLLVVRGGDSPVVACSYAATGLLLMVALSTADRQRFADRDPELTIVEVIEPEPVAAPAPVVPRAPLVPLAEQMHVALPVRVDVT